VCGKEEKKRGNSAILQSKSNLPGRQAKWSSAYIPRSNQSTGIHQAIPDPNPDPTLTHQALTAPLVPNPNPNPNPNPDPNPKFPNPNPSGPDRPAGETPACAAVSVPVHASRGEGFGREKSSEFDNGDFLHV
jgi:hypothetical protein